MWKYVKQHILSKRITQFRETNINVNIQMNDVCHWYVPFKDYF